MIARRQLDQKDADGHPDRPHGADHRVHALGHALVDHADENGGEQGDHHGAGQRRQTAEHTGGERGKEDRRPQAPDGHVRDRPAEEHDAALDDVGAHETARDARAETGEEPREQEGVGGHVREESVHAPRPPPRGGAPSSRLGHVSSWWTTRTDP